MAIFMLYDGIDGEHTFDGTPGYIELQSVSWGMTRSSASVRPSLRSRIEPAVQEVACTKIIDGSSVALVTEGLTGKFDRTVTIKFVRQGTSQLLPYLVYTLYEAGLTSFQQAGSGDGTPVESFTLNFTAIDVQYTVYEDDLTGIPSNVLYHIGDSG
ncbi:type VI secretion system tube protein Hcp [Belnapia sp. T6]|uniref:Type VI secretion system tube protein Hcp n=1 Tax=Belnapia mucosa TaxID=2804532 RepID=A0ABS1V5F3_9PROT|nr:type VI secretion system tube protein Hcp [Belnapia mucosa]MBL6456918.1 type VI secretion system tube protein Hcp [Belnapia mucosa]